MADRIVVLVESDVDAPIAHGFVARHAAVIASLRRHGKVQVVGITSTPTMLAPDVDALVAVPGRPAPTSDVRRFVAAATSELGRFGIGRDLGRLRDVVAALDPTLIVSLTWQRREVVRAVGPIAPTALFAEERLSVMAGQPLRWTFPPPLLSLVEMRSQRRTVSLAKVIAVIGPREVPWAQAAFHRPVVVVPLAAEPVSLVESAVPATQLDVAVVGNLAEGRNADGLVEIIDEAARRRWPGDLRFRLASATGFDRRLVERSGHHVVLEGQLEDVGLLLAQSRCRLVPAFKALGIKTQILQGWAAQRPVVTTMRSARTVGGRHGVDLLVGETPAEVVDLLVGLEERDDLDRLVVAGLARLEDDFSPTVVDASVDEVVSRLHAAKR